MSPWLSESQRFGMNSHDMRIKHVRENGAWSQLPRACGGAAGDEFMEEQHVVCVKFAHWKSRHGEREFAGPRPCDC